MMGEPFGVDEATCIRETNDAILVDATLFDEPQWVPKSGVHPDSDVQEEGDEGTLFVEGWLAEDRGWSEE